MVLRFGVKNIKENLLFFTRTITVTSFSSQKQFLSCYQPNNGMSKMGIQNPLKHLIWSFL